MKKIYVLAIFAMSISFGCSKKGADIDPPQPPPPPTPKPSISVNADTAWYKGSGKISWTVANATSLTVNGVSVPLSHSVTLNNMTKDSSFVLVASNAAGESDSKTAVVRVHSECMTYFCKGPWKHVISMARKVGTTQWFYYPPWCYELWFNPNGSWISGAGSCEDGQDRNGSPNWYFLENETKITWTAGYNTYQIMKLTADSLVLYERRKYVNSEDSLDNIMKFVHP